MSEYWDAKQQKLVSTPDPKPEVKEEPMNSTTITQLVSETDAYIGDRMRSQAKTLEEVTVEIKDASFSNYKNLLSLPPEFEKYTDTYAFRWVSKKKRALDHAYDVVKWRFVNRVLFPKEAKHLFTASGTVERGDTVLMFMPVKRAVELRLEPARKSRERVENTPVQDLKKWKDRGEQYYKPSLSTPKDGAEDRDNDKGIVRVPDEEIKDTDF